VFWLDLAKNNSKKMLKYIVLLLFICLIDKFRCTPEQRLENAIHHVALATLAVGPRAKSFADTLIQSYQANAQTKCPLYIVTEDIPYFDKVLNDIDSLTKGMYI
jgi:hypothetical protein